jgi:anti-anti-sigma factor
MEMSVRQLEGGMKIIALVGELDIEGTMQIDLRLATEIAAEKAFVVFDLTQVPFMASVGLGVLIRSAKALRLRGGEAVVLSTVPAINTILEKTRITEIIKVFADLESACEALRPRP